MSTEKIDRFSKDVIGIVKMVIPELLELAAQETLHKIIERFADEETPLDKRLQKILERI